MAQANTQETPQMIMRKRSKLRSSRVAISRKSGWTIFQTLKAIKERTENPDTIPMIDVMRVPKTDKHYVVDESRRLYMYKKLARCRTQDEISVDLLPYQAELCESEYKFTTTNKFKGISAKVNGYSSLGDVLERLIINSRLSVYDNKRQKIHTTTRPRSCKQLQVLDYGDDGSESSTIATATEGPVSSGGFAARHDFTDAYSDNDDDDYDDAPVSYRRFDDDGDDDEEGYTNYFDEEIYNKPTRGYRRSSRAPRCRPVPIQLDT